MFLKNGTSKKIEVREFAQYDNYPMALLLRDIETSFKEEAKKREKSQNEAYYKAQTVFFILKQFSNPDQFPKNIDEHLTISSDVTLSLIKNLRDTVLVHYSAAHIKSVVFSYINDCLKSESIEFVAA